MTSLRVGSAALVTLSKNSARSAAAWGSRKSPVRQSRRSAEKSGSLASRLARHQLCRPAELGVDQGTGSIATLSVNRRRRATLSFVEATC